MRPVFSLALLLTLPALMLAHRSYFLRYEQPQLLEKARAALDEPAFANVAEKGLSMNYRDVALQGLVETPELREQARARVAAVRGVRCREEDNHLKIPARLSAKLDDETLVLNGWMPNEATLNDLTQWLIQNRPGLKVDTVAVKLSPWVTHPGTPTATPLPAVYQDAWNAIRLKSSLRIERKDGRIIASGMLPSGDLRTAVVASLSGDKKAPVPVQDSDLKTGPFVRNAHFAQADALPAFLKDFFQSPFSEFFEADGEVIRLRGAATPEMEARWRELLLPLAERQDVAADLQLYPTRCAFPNYVPESKLPPEAITKLREALKPAVFHFEPNSFYLQAAEVPKLNAAAQAIAAAGREARIIVGGYQETEGDPKAQQNNAVKRCETIIAEFKDRGMPTSLFEMTIYSPAIAPNGAANRRVVELLLK